MFRKIIIFSCLICIVLGQASLGDLNRLSNKQIDLIKNKLKIENDNLADTSFEVKSDIPSDMINSKEVNIVQSQDKSEPEPESEFFGYNYFLREINFFDNTPTPSNFRLGPGDEIILSLWGESNLRSSFFINKEGFIFYENIGFISLANKTIAEAELLLKNEFSKIYSTLNDQDNSTNLMLELGKVGSVNIYFSGEVASPGIHVIHPFSDIFTALVQAGGILESGSLREVKLIRENKIISTIDFYSFFMDGKNEFFNIKLIDGDVIHIPSVKKRVSIEGEITRPKKYELLDNESFLDLIKFAGGLTPNASSFLLVDQVKPIQNRSSDDNAISSLNLKIGDAAKIKVNHGDKVLIKSIGEVDSKVSVIGRVKNPGDYSAINSSLKDVLDLAGGFDDPIFRQSINDKEIVILRQDSKNFYNIEIVSTYEDSENIQLVPNDKIFIYEDINYRNSLTYRVEGEVNKPGTFVFKEGITVADAIKNAQGLTDLSSYSNILISNEFTGEDEDGNRFITNLDISSSNLDFIISPNTVITALPIQNVVRVNGNVYNPGLVAYSSGLTVYQAIINSGGYKPYTIKRSIYVKKSNGEINTVKIFNGRFHYLNPGDSIFVPVDENPTDFEITNFISDLSTTLANIAAILLIVDNQTN